MKKITKKVLTLGTTLALTLSCFSTSYASNYLIQKGDTLSIIASKYNVSVATLKSSNNLTSDEIFAGKYLYIPTTTTHTVQKGESLYLIGQKYGVTPQNIKELNNLSSDTIEINQILEIPNRQSTLSSRGYSYTASASEIDLLAALVYGEARGESLEGQIAVASVVLNRLYSNNFPNTIREVIYQDLAFTAVADGQIYLTPDTMAYSAVRLALNGYDPSCGSLYYWNPLTATSKWIWSREVILKIGNHLFGI